MARKVTAVEEPKPSVVALPVPKTFTVDYDDEAGIVSFELADGTPVVMKKPRTRQLLLIDSWRNSVEPEYLTNAFTSLKLASLCITKFGDKDKATFDDLADLDFENCERVVKALECFRDVFEHLQQHAASAGAVSPGNDT
ncbi:hypothetical protein NIES2109_22900 [Nostoc sp. HK-01]|nr:hypothetical protein NIES2109_22900 [Nostoc sp. HK-01]